MRIGINAGILAHQVTGIGRYTLAIIEFLSKNKQHEFFIYLPDKIPLEHLSFIQNLTVRYSYFTSGLGKKIWEQTVLPIWAKKDQLDVFWSPSHHLPYWLPRTTSRVVTIHDIVWKKYPETMRWWNYFSESLLMPMSVKSADQIICVSSSTANDIATIWPSSLNKTNVIYPGISDIKKSTETKPIANIKKQYILFVGTLEPRKNLSRLIQAYLSLPLNLKDTYDLVIVGGKGWGDHQLLRDSDSDKIQFTGYLSDYELGLVYEKASLFVMPSLYEGFGLPLIEAMSYGVPVVTSNCSSMPEVAGSAAVIVNPNEVSSLSDGILRVLSDKNIQEALVLEGYKRVQLFSWLDAAQKTLSVFERSLKN